MSGMSDLLEAITTAERNGDDSVLASVVKVEGSAYRRPGARMLIPVFGGTVGTVSGGCLEAELAKKAWWFTEAGAPVVRRYSTNADDTEDDPDRSLTFGLGCNGTVHVMLERLVAGKPSAVVDLLRCVRQSHSPAAMATVISSYRNALVRVGERIILNPSGQYIGGFRNPRLQANVCSDLADVLSLRKSGWRFYADQHGATEVFLEYLPPPTRLVIFGAGHDAQPLVQMAKLLDWHVTVVDGRAHFARTERFPLADQVIVADQATVTRQIGSLQGAAVVVMTHSYVQDRQWLDVALTSAAAYIGQLGPRERTERLLDDLNRRPAALPALDRLHYPMGLDTGGDSPETVAMAILAEITAVLNHRQGGQLKHRGTPIHPTEAAIYQALTPASEHLADQR
ncbi:XdhC family protein [Pseudomonas kielensis]|uniref:XdhC family protein n=1 Tax=Pseudomonas kielensis TaxID=2762577 RepID=UPI0038A06030